MFGNVRKAVRWALGEAWEKINVVATWRTLKELGRKHGKRFFIAAVVWECIEDGLLPLLSWWAGVPELIPIFLIFHFEPISYPCIFWLFRMWDRSKGRIPWDPNRSAASSYSRSLIKVGVYQMAALGWLWAFIIPLDGVRAVGVVAFFAALMTVFGFIHERVWHDTNFGIRTDDSVQLRRTLAKSFTYLVVSALIMFSALRAIVPQSDWLQALLIYQGVGTALYVVLECVWAKSAWGIRPTENVKMPDFVGSLLILSNGNQPYNITDATGHTLTVSPAFEPRTNRA